MNKYDIVKYPYEYEENPQIIEERYGLVIDDDIVLSIAKITGAEHGKRSRYDYILRDWKLEGLTKPSIVRCDHIQTALKNYIDSYEGHLTDRDIQGIENIINNVVNESLSRSFKDLSIEDQKHIISINKKDRDKFESLGGHITYAEDIGDDPTDEYYARKYTNEISRHQLMKYGISWSINESVEKHDGLNPDIFKDNEIIPEVKDKLLEIVDKFKENLKEDEVELDVKDIVILGSNASYNYTKDSDIDLHIIADLSVYPNQEELATKLYNAYKTLWNNKYDPMIKKHEVELYVEPERTNAKSNGIYSLNTGWVKEPVKDDIPDIDTRELEKQLQPFEDRVQDLLADPNAKIEDIDKVIDDLYLLRQNSIIKDGEYGIGNLVFKEIRNQGYLKKLKELKVELENKDMSLESLDELPESTITQEDELKESNNGVKIQSSDEHMGRQGYISVTDNGKTFFVATELAGEVWKLADQSVWPHEDIKGYNDLTKEQKDILDSNKSKVDRALRESVSTKYRVRINCDDQEQGEFVSDMILGDPDWVADFGDKGFVMDYYFNDFESAQEFANQIPNDLEWNVIETNKFPEDYNTKCFGVCDSDKQKKKTERDIADKEYQDNYKKNKSKYDIKADEDMSDERIAELRAKRDRWEKFKEEERFSYEYNTEREFKSFYKKHRKEKGLKPFDIYFDDIDIVGKDDIDGTTLYSFKDGETFKSVANKLDKKIARKFHESFGWPMNLDDADPEDRARYEAEHDGTLEKDSKRLVYPGINWIWYYSTDYDDAYNWYSELTNGPKYADQNIIEFPTDRINYGFNKYVDRGIDKVWGFRIHRDSVDEPLNEGVDYVSDAKDMIRDCENEEDIKDTENYIYTLAYNFRIWDDDEEYLLSLLDKKRNKLKNKLKEGIESVPGFMTPEEIRDHERNREAELKAEKDAEKEAARAKRKAKRDAEKAELKSRRDAYRKEHHDEILRNRRIDRINNMSWDELVDRVVKLTGDEEGVGDLTDSELRDILISNLDESLNESMEKIRVADYEDADWSVEAYRDGDDYYFTPKAIKELNRNWGYDSGLQEPHPTKFYKKKGQLWLHSAGDDQDSPVEKVGDLYKFPFPWNWIEVGNVDEGYHKSDYKATDEYPAKELEDLGFGKSKDGARYVLDLGDDRHMEVYPPREYTKVNRMLDQDWLFNYYDFNDGVKDWHTRRSCDTYEELLDFVKEFMNKKNIKEGYGPDFQDEYDQHYNQPKGDDNYMAIMVYGDGGIISRGFNTEQELIDKIKSCREKGIGADAYYWDEDRDHWSNYSPDLGESITEAKLGNGYEFKFPEVLDTLKVYLQWEGIIGFEDDIMDYQDTTEEDLDAFLQEEGIIGYTNEIWDILQGEPAYCSNMEEEDFLDVCDENFVDPELNEVK